MDLINQTIDINQAMEQLIPEQVLVVYGNQRDSFKYIEKSKLANGSPIGFHPITANEIRGVLGKINAAENGLIQCRGLFPKNILWMDIIQGDFKLLWYRPTMYQLVKFDKECNLKNSIVKVPSLLFFATRTNIKVFAIKKKPSMNTELYEAPFFNVFADGRICMGDVKINIPSITSFDEIIRLWETYFWSSQFTMSGSTATLKIWQKLCKGYKEIYPLDKLKLHSKYKKLNSLIS